MRDKKLEFCFHSKFGKISYSFLKIVSFINFYNISIFVHLSVVYKEALEKSSFFSYIVTWHYHEKHICRLKWHQRSSQRGIRGKIKHQI